MLTSTIQRDEDQISLVSSAGSSASTAESNSHRHRPHRAGHRLAAGAAVFTGCLPSFGGGNGHHYHHRDQQQQPAGSSSSNRGEAASTATVGGGGNAPSKVSHNKSSPPRRPGGEAQLIDHGGGGHHNHHCAATSIEMSPSRVCRTGTLSTSVTEPQLSSFGSNKVPMDFSHTTGKIIDDPDEVIAMLKEEQWRAKDQVRFHSPDNRLPYLSSYLIQPWFHGEMSRDDAVSMIGANGAKEGTFLIRLSRSLPGCFVLSISHAGGVLHYPITQVKDPSGDKLLSLDSGRTKFMDLIQLVEFYQVNAANYLPTTLRHFVTRAVDVPRSAKQSASPRSSV